MFILLIPFIQSNLFMKFDWHGRLKFSSGTPLIRIIIMIFFFEHLLQVPANRIGIHDFNLGQIKIIQEIIAMTVFSGFAFFCMRQPLQLDFLWAGSRLVGAAYFISRGNFLHVR